MKNRFVRPKEAMARLGIGRTKFYDDIAKGVLPKLVRLGPKSSAMPEDELDAVIERRKAERDAGKAA